MRKYLPTKTLCALGLLSLTHHVAVAAEKAAAIDPVAVALLTNTAERYGNLKTYSDKTEFTQTASAPGSKVLKLSQDIRFKSPNTVRVTALSEGVVLNFRTFDGVAYKLARRTGKNAEWNLQNHELEGTVDRSVEFLKWKPVRDLSTFLVGVYPFDPVKNTPATSLKLKTGEIFEGIAVDVVEATTQNGSQLRYFIGHKDPLLLKIEGAFPLENGVNVLRTEIHREIKLDTPLEDKELKFELPK